MGVKILGFSLLLLFGCETATATVWQVDAGGTTTIDNGYGGYSNSPVLAFSPVPLTINAGDSVTFSNLGGAAHNVHADDNSFRCANGCDDSGGDGSASSAHWTFTRTFNTPGTIAFHCDVHASMGMTGSIVVNAVTTPSIKLGGYLSGNWFMPSQGGGQGFQLEFTNAPGSAPGLKSALAIWFAYTPAGSALSDGSGQNWIYAQGDFDPATSSVTLPAVLLAGARFPPNFNGADLHRVPNDSSLWGNLTFAFSDCDHGTVSWHSDLTGYGNANDTPTTIQRLTQIDGTSCPQ